MVQLATKIEGWNDTTSWWGIDTLDGNNTYAYLPKYRSPLRPGCVERRSWQRNLCF